MTTTAALVMIAAAAVTALLISVVIMRQRHVANAEVRTDVRLLAEHVVDMVSTHEADGTFRYVSPVFAGLVGEYPGTLVGKHPRDFAHPDDVQTIAGLCKRVLAYSGTTATAVWRCRRHDGDYVWVETTARARANDNSQLGAVVCASRDINERKQIEDALRTSEQRFRSALETIRFVAVGLDVEGRITFCNDALCALTGWRRTELIGEIWWDRIATPNDAFRPIFSDSIHAGSIPSHNESEITCRDGTRRLIEWDNTVLRNTDGSVSGTASLGIDVTDRKRYEAQLLRARDDAETASRAKSDFLSRMSHELRTPLNSVIGFANVMRKNKSGRLTGEEIAFLDRIVANGQHLLALVNNVLDISKVEAGRLVVTLGPVAIDELAREVVAQLEGSPRAAGVELRADLPSRIEPIDSDIVLLRQVLINLAGNALRFTHEGSVVVAVEADDKTGRPLRIHVRDTGIGIDPSRHAAIFEPFEQADPTTHRTYGGTGLGLSISRSICEALGFRLTVASEPGKGATFTLDMSEIDRPVPAPDSSASSPADALHARNTAAVTR
jgi:PAS domain S-box-containing protein